MVVYLWSGFTSMMHYPFQFSKVSISSVIELPESWLLIDPETDEQFILSQPPLLQTVSGEGLRLRVAGGRWSVMQTDGKVSSLPDTAADVVLSPDGSTVAYLDGGKAYLWRNGIGEPLLSEPASDWQILSLAWSPMIWKAEGGFENRG